MFVDVDVDVDVLLYFRYKYIMDDELLFNEFDALPSKHNKQSGMIDLPITPTHPILPEAPSHLILPKAPSAPITSRSVLQGYKNTRNNLFNEYVALLHQMVFDRKMNECYNKYPATIGKNRINVTKLYNELDRLDKIIHAENKGGSVYKKKTMSKRKNRCTKRKI
jgi:hypothetical protein